MTPCETCGGEGTVIEFHRFAGEYMAGEPVEVECPDCEGQCELDDDEGTPIPSLAELIAKHGSQLTDPVRGDPFLKHNRRAA